MKKIIIPFVITATFVVMAFLFFNNLETFFSNMLNNVSKHPNTFALTSFLILTLDIVLPVPSTIVMFVNGYVLGIIYGTILSLLSLITGAVIGYYLGHLTSWGLKAKSDDNTNSILAKYGALAIILTRGIPIISESICVVCGYNKMALKQYVLYNLIGYLPLCVLFAICGQLGYNENTFLISFGSSMLITALFWLFGRSYLSKSKIVKFD